jgi:hypothetical protein
MQPQRHRSFRSWPKLPTSDPSLRHQAFDVFFCRNVISHVPVTPAAGETSGVDELLLTPTLVPDCRCVLTDADLWLLIQLVETLPPFP